MSDVPMFITFAGAGLFSGENGIEMIPPNVTNPDRFPPLDAAVNTYALSEVLSKHNFTATALATSTLAAFQLERISSPKSTVYHSSVSTGGESETFYWSSVTQRQYQVSSTGTPAANGATDPSAALTLYENLQGLSLPVSFDGAYDCTLEGKAKGSSVVNVNADGTLDVSCLTVLPMYLPKNTACPQGAVTVDGNCPFGCER